jgi:hypothetical protein
MDDTFANTTGATGQQGVPLRFQPFGVAESCEGDTVGLHGGHANVDFCSTPFTLNQTFGTGGLAQWGKITCLDYYNRSGT